MNPFNRFRLFHALFVIGFLAVYFSGDDGDLLHVWLGYGLVVLVAIRLLLALIRVKGFPALWPTFRSGAVSITVNRVLVIALFLSASATLTTGLIMVDHVRVLSLAATQVIAPAYADDDEAWEKSGRMLSRFSGDEIEEIHEIIANTTLVIAAIHIGFMLAFQRRFALNMIPGFEGLARRWRGLASKASGVGGDYLRSIPAVNPPKEEVVGWSGFRNFKVARRVIEDSAQQICSFYLEPEDRQSLPSFKPGQFLTFRLDVPKADGGCTEQITRCYSLSDAPHSDHYRVSIKRVPSPPRSDHLPGRSSNFFHDHIQVGTTLQVRAPSGHFYLEPGSSPIVLIAGGIGITPMLSMLNWCQAHQPEREVWFFYGVGNGKETAFTAHLSAIAAAKPSVYLRLCFSDPLPEDQLGKDFHHHGRVDVNLFRRELPLTPYHYYICGPTPMMETLVSALDDWGVPDSHIHLEAFGPAFIKRRKPETTATGSAITAPVSDITVSFAKSGKQAQWSLQSGSLLEFAESQGIAIDSGCRAGGCGTCQTTIRSGEVSYRQSPDYDPEPGTCLMCVCTPKTHVTLEA
jgi:hypothetical protein